MKPSPLTHLACAVALLALLSCVAPSGGTEAPASGLTPSPSRPRIDGTIAAQGFGSTDAFTLKADPDPPQKVAVLSAVRTGFHPEEGGWDRIVFEFEDQLPPGTVRYVRDAIQCGSGFPVAAGGGAVMQVRFDTASAHTAEGTPTVSDRGQAGPGGSIIRATQTCDYEAEVTWHLGVTGEQRFKVTKLQGPPRVVIDIKH